MYKTLKETTYNANIAIKKSGLVLLTWGNVSVKDDVLKVTVSYTHLDVYKRQQAGCGGL